MNNALDLSYEHNDRVALAADLVRIRQLGFTVLPLATLAQWFAAGEFEQLGSERFVAITMDDGPLSDYADCGAFRSAHSILKDYVLARGPVCGDGPVATSFVLGSTEARRQLGVEDHWWRDSARQNILGIGVHGWDHLANVLDVVAQRNNVRNDFSSIDCYEDADTHFTRSREYIERNIGMPSRVFAYPFGQASEYLMDEYLPTYESEHKILACFGTGGKYVTEECSRWYLPRFVHGHHWGTQAEFDQMMRGEL